MKKDGLPLGHGNLNAFLGEGTSFNGKLSFEGTVRIDGKFEGEIVSGETLLIGEAATVRATIRAGIIVIGGTVHGNITAEKNVELHRGARLFGNLSTPLLSVADGVLFEGSCTMGKKKPGEKAEPRKGIEGGAASGATIPSS